MNELNEFDNNEFFDDKKINAKVSMDTFLESQIVMLIDAQRKSDIYIKTCKNMINSYEKKIKKANERTETIIKQFKDEIKGCLIDGFKSDYLDMEKDFENRKDGNVYKIPSAIIFLKKKEPIIVDMNKFVKFKLDNDLDVLDDEFFQELIVQDNKIIHERSGLILDSTSGVNLSDEEILIKFYNEVIT